MDAAGELGSRLPLEPTPGDHLMDVLLSRTGFSDEIRSGLISCEGQVVFAEVHTAKPNPACVPTQRVKYTVGETPVLRVAQGHEKLGLMGSKRGIDAISRQNLIWVIEACSRRLKKAKGGQAYLARLLGCRPHYLSAVIHGYDNRNLGRDYKTKIEQLFKLDPDWMDREHDESVVDYLVPRVPSLPHQRNIGTPSVPTSYVERLESTLEEALKRIAALESEVGSRSSTRRKP